MFNTVKHTLAFAGLLLFLPFTLKAQDVRADVPQRLNVVRTLSDTEIRFRVGSAALDTSFADNGAKLSAFVADVNAFLAAEATSVSAVTIETAASPEGDPDFNETLAMARAKSLRAWLVEHLPLNASQVKAYAVGPDWEGMTMAVRRSDVEWKDEILAVIAETGVRTAYDKSRERVCQNRLKAIDGGRAWQWLSTDVFPTLRSGSGIIKCVTETTVAPVRDTVVVVHEYKGQDNAWDMDEATRQAAEQSSAIVLKSLEKKARRHKNDSLWRVPVMALRTNFVMPLMNIGVEVPLSNRWSLGADLYSPWAWRNWTDAVLPPSHKYCFQGLGGTLEARVWTGVSHSKKDDYGKYRLTGSSFGLVLGAGYYDAEWQWNGRQGEYAVAGLSYMYSIPMGRRAGTRLELEACFGWGITRWRGYDVHEDGGPLVGNWNDGTWSGPIPMRLGINLVVPFFDSDKPMKGRESHE